MTNKHKFIIAFENTIYKYLHPKWHNFTTCKACPICKAAKKNCEVDSCLPCPMANAEKTVGCVEFRTYKAMSKKFHQVDFVITAPPKEFLDRTDALRKIINVIAKWPESRFTKRGWKYSGKELPRTW